MEFEFFWQSSSPFSQWYLADYTINGTTFSCCEQGMMYAKAKLFGDEDAARQILLSRSPKDVKVLGRLVKNFKQAVWEANRERIVYEGNMAKFSQNALLCERLLRTGSKTLVEASPYDRIWGIGMRASDPRANDPSKWNGLNLLGSILTRVKNDLRSTATPSISIATATATVVEASDAVEVELAI